MASQTDLKSLKIFWTTTWLNTPFISTHTTTAEKDNKQLLQELLFTSLSFRPLTQAEILKWTSDALSHTQSMSATFDIDTIYLSPAYSKTRHPKL